MILKCFLLFLVIVDNFIVDCVVSSASGKYRVPIEISVVDDDNTTQDAETLTRILRNKYPAQDPTDILYPEYSDASSNLSEQRNITQLEEFPHHDFNASSEEINRTTQINLEIPAVLEYDEETNSSEIQELDRVVHSKLFTTLLNLEEDYNMSFDKMAKIFVNENVENNLEKKRRRKERNEKTMDVYADLEDDLVESEFVKQEVKYKSLGIEPLALIVIPEVHTKHEARGITTTTPSWNERNERTGYLLASDHDIDKATFVAKNKSAKQIELQEDLTNITHMAAYLKKTPENTVYLLPPLTVELAEDSTLLMNANERQEIPFEVTNNLNNAARVTFTVRDELGILLEIDRYIAILGPHASTTVRVAVLPKSGQSSDRITFIATGSEQVRKEVIVDIESNDYRSDTDSPLVDYTYTSDCTDVVLSKCKEGTWTIKISAKDTESGLKLLTTIPKGLYFPEGYTAGTREEVTGIYSESCCNADLQIIAIDRMNNRYARQINAYRAPLSFWAVTAITLVSLIFLTIIIVSSLICLKKCKRSEADSFDLPTYRGGRSRY
ncbi:uncharacterized protein LOC123321563 isoform X2 [Coccinella septempunctata]|uniref:uncharacterized protein LOC123321563 isoform X2 n=1 Tax=Coccinella septempunctata TaxID=41139 RepID=UPI001D069F38|nr:uncharacterized protein LOC123321563 isoform X2 [Coccinella septempunctata]